MNFHKLSRVLEHALSEYKSWTKTFLGDSHHMKINQGFIIKSSHSKENCEVIYNICLKLSILKCTLYYMHYVTTIVLRIYELIQKNKCTFIFTKFTNYAIEDTMQEKSFSSEKFGIYRILRICHVIYHRRYTATCNTNIQLDRK